MAERNQFFVCGAPKSGTTWLQRILDAHPQIHCSGEGHFIERFSAPLAKVLRDYTSHMSLVAERVYEGRPYYPALAQEDLDRIARGFIIDRLMSRNPGPEVRWIGDKTPRYTGNLPALLRLFPSARIINIVRDPRDVAMARMHHARRAGLAEQVAEETPERIKFIREGGLVWANCVVPVEAFSAQHPGTVYTVRYEDLLEDGEEQIRGLFRFLVVTDDDALVSRVKEITSFEAMTGRKPGEEHATSFLRKGVAGDWKGRLEPAALAALEETCGDVMRAHGYH